MKGWFSSFRPLCSVFTHVARNYANLLEKRKRLRKKYSSPPTRSLTGLVCETNTTTVSLFSNTDVCCVWPPRRHEKTLHTLSTQLMKPFQCQWHVLDLFSACNHWCCPIVHQALRLSKATKLVFSRLPFVFITIGGCTESLIATSIAAFGPKLLESQYYVPAGRAALLFGLVTVSVALFGNMLGKSIRVNGT